MSVALGEVAQIGRAVADGGIEAWLVGAGVVALYLAYRAVKLVARVLSLAGAAALFLAGAPAERLPAIDVPWHDDLHHDAPAGADVAAPADAFTAVVTSVTDGDTLRARVTAPGGSPVAAGTELELRLLRVDAPERAPDDRPAECLADAATDALRRLTAPGTEVRAVHDVERRDRFDRHLVHLWTAGGTWVNGALLTAGLAEVVTIPPNTAFEAEVRAAEAAARAARRGVWDPSAC